MVPAFEHVRKRHRNAHTPEKKAQLWAAYQRLGNATAAAEEVGINPNTAQKMISRHKKRLASSEGPTPVLNRDLGDEHVEGEVS